jgi:hypothetical protein
VGLKDVKFNVALDETRFAERPAALRARTKLARELEIE